MGGLEWLRPGNKRRHQDEFTNIRAWMLDSNVRFVELDATSPDGRSLNVSMGSFTESIDDLHAGGATHSLPALAAACRVLDAELGALTM